MIAPYLSPQTIAAVILIIGAVYIRDAGRKFTTQVKLNTEESQKQLKLLNFRQEKILAVMAICPSIPKENVWWLVDDAKNSKPPAKSNCTARCPELNKVS